MITFRNLIGLFLIFFGIQLFAQGNYDIVFPTNESLREQNCKQCFDAFRQKPKEVSFSIKREGVNLYFETNDKAWFSKLFGGAKDGLAIDVVSKERYSCDQGSIVDTQIKGLLLKPVYKDRLMQTIKPDGKDRFKVLVGKIPEGLKDADLEYNILFLGNNNLCNYYVIYDLKSYNLDLLDMGLYLDSLVYTNNSLKPMGQEAYKIRYKNMRFVIPFQKNKSQYNAEDIKPMYDSLNLTDFNIKSIDIKAYSSIEGRQDRNIELQEQRANSIVKALQSYQTPRIETDISSSENWVEFLNDIEGTKYADLKNLSKSQLKSKLTGAFAQEMEPILKDHRKAVVSLQLDKKDIYKDMSSNDLVTAFNSAVGNSNINEAEKILNTIFDRLRFTEKNPDLLNRLVVPKKKNLANILNSISAFKYQLDERNLLIVRRELKEIEQIDPTNKRVKYNLAVITFKIWRYNVEPVDDNKFKSEIQALTKYGIDKSLVDRMMINYHIVKAENYMQARDYAKKDASVDYIYKNYTKQDLSDSDAVSLAQFLSYYANTEKAANVLDEKARQIAAEEDLLFYYLNLTMIRQDITQRDSYRTIMLNAINQNKNRFCKLFNPVDMDGVTFQLLEDDYLRTTYCENCEN